MSDGYMDKNNLSRIWSISQGRDRGKGILDWGDSSCKVLKICDVFEYGCVYVWVIWKPRLLRILSISNGFHYCSLSIVAILELVY